MMPSFPMQTSIFRQKYLQLIRKGAVAPVSFIHTMTVRSVLPGCTVPRQFLQLQRQMKAVKVQKQKLQRRQVQKTEIPTTVLLLMQRRTKNLRT